MKLTVEGIEAFAATGGRPFDPARPALVFVHGAGMDHTVWTLQTRYFAHHGWSVLALDLPGHGGSAGPALEDVPAMAAWVRKAVSAAGATKFAVAGHSLGALIALEAASRAGEDALALMMLGAAAAMPVNPALQGAADKGEHSAVEAMIGWGFGRPAQIGGNRAPGAWMPGAGLRTLERGLKGPLGIDLKASNGYAGAVEAAGKVACPVLIVAGDDDRMTPLKGAKALAGSFADARLAVLPATGHMMSIERPDETLDALRDFLQGIAA
ncbi:alpha/beta fold hydrolase [Thalassobaculum salexigens]|uniref:alpha/beta fold hydrolase n=1 Tax=Thalassobaculum salexigens TaxID=455360 RepID=UPI00248DD775|nr:alpha/beta hydrolase [Thalassobaculum salexigens]